MSEQKDLSNGFSDQQNRVDTEFIKCPGCGANMEFNPQTQALYCPHCGSETKFDTQKIASEKELLGGFSEDQTWKEGETSVFRCDNCGAEVVLNIDETASECPFCGTPHVTKSEGLSGLKPNAVIPFSLDGEKALELTKAWAKKKFFAPSKFKKNLKAENLKGIYTPCFTFDSYTTSRYVARLGKTYTRTVGYGKNRRVETYTVWRDVCGTHYDNFDDVLISAGSKFDQRKINKLSPFDTNFSKQYQEQYLLGFMAYRYDHELTDCWDNAKVLIDKAIERTILSKYSYDKVAFINVSTSHEHVTYKYVMLPVYVGNFRYAKKIYNFFVNGSSGKVMGDTPKSFWKILATVLGGLIVGALVFALIYFFGS